MDCGVIAKACVFVFKILFYFFTDAKKYFLTLEVTIVLDELLRSLEKPLKSIDSGLLEFNESKAHHSCSLEMSSTQRVLTISTFLC